MKKYLKEGILLVLLCIFAGIQSGTVYGEESNGLYYYIDEWQEGEPTVCVNGYVGTEENLVIPEELEGYKVTEVFLWPTAEDEPDAENTTVKTITLPSGVTNFYVYDFKALTDIYVEEGNETYQSLDGVLYNKDGTELCAYPYGKQGKVEVKEGVKTISYGALSDNVTEIYLPASYEDVSRVPIRRCENLEKVSVAEENPLLKTVDDVLYNKEGTTLIQYPRKKKGSVNIPEGVTKIPYGAFYDCSLVEKVIMPDTVTEIEEYAFYSCESLTEVKLSANLEKLYEYTFAECASLKELTIPCKMTYITPVTFWKSGIENLIIEEGNSSLTFSDGILYREKGKLLVCCLPAVSGEVVVPEGVVTVAYSAFDSCSKVTKVTLPDSVEEIDSMAFQNCVSLEEIQLSRNLRVISGEVFKECFNLKEIRIPESVTKIESDAFEGCYNLKNVWIDSMKITDLGNDLFSSYSDHKVQVYLYDENLYNMFMGDERKSTGADIILLKKVEPLELSKYSVTLYTGSIKNAAVIKAVLTDINGTVKWSTSDKSIATVQNGKIKAVGKGRAVITAKAGNYKKTVQVTVKNPTILVVDGSESISTIQIKKGKTVHYRVNVNPTGAVLKLEQGKNSKKTANVSVKKNTLSVKGVKKGTMTFTLKSGKGSKKITVKVK